MSREIYAANTERAWGVNWVFSAPWAHPVWSDYVLMLYDLTSTLGGRGRRSEGSVIRYLDGVTHEFMLHALMPRQEIVDVDRPWSELRLTTPVLRPPNFAYQIRMPDDAAALVRLQKAVDLIDKRALSPDTDARAQWKCLFSDGVSLLRSFMDQPLIPVS